MSETKLFGIQDVANAANMVAMVVQKNEEQQTEITRLKQLNREMVEAIKLNCKTCGDYRCEQCACGIVLAKAEGRGE